MFAHLACYIHLPRYLLEFVLFDSWTAFTNSVSNIKIIQSRCNSLRAQLYPIQTLEKVWKYILWGQYVGKDEQCIETRNRNRQKCSRELLIIIGIKWISESRAFTEKTWFIIVDAVAPPQNDVHPKGFTEATNILVEQHIPSASIVSLKRKLNQQNGFVKYINYSKKSFFHRLIIQYNWAIIY